MKNLLILYSKYTPVIDAITFRLNNIANIDCILEKDFDKNSLNQYDLVVLLNYNKQISVNALSVHHSLMLNFEEQDPVKDAVIKGLKVTGITIFYTKTKKIVSQYPIFINNDTHYDSLVKELDYLEQTLFPIVIEKIIKNKPFETQTLLNSKGHCGGCCGCHH